jgi:cytochrome b subunit of formate dehydrogenase
MTLGTVDEQWARAHHRKWADDVGRAANDSPLAGLPEVAQR